MNVLGLDVARDRERIPVAREVVGGLVVRGGAPALVPSADRRTFLVAGRERQRARVLAARAAVHAPGIAVPGALPPAFAAILGVVRQVPTTIFAAGLVRISALGVGG